MIWDCSHRDCFLGQWFARRRQLLLREAKALCGMLPERTRTAQSARSALRTRSRQKAHRSQLPRSPDAVCPHVCLLEAGATPRWRLGKQRTGICTENAKADTSDTMVRSPQNPNFELSDPASVFHELSFLNRSGNRMAARPRLRHQLPRP